MSREGEAREDPSKPPAWRAGLDPSSSAASALAGSIRLAAARQASTWSITAAQGLLAAGKPMRFSPSAVYSVRAARPSPVNPSRMAYLSTTPVKVARQPPRTP